MLVFATEENYGTLPSLSGSKKQTPRKPRCGCKFVRPCGNTTAWFCSRGLLYTYEKIPLGGETSNIVYGQPYLGKIPNLTNIFQRGWNHQLVILLREFVYSSDFFYFLYLVKSHHEQITIWII